MNSARLVIRALAYYRQSTAAVVLGVATAVAVLGGALLVGDSVRGSLRDLVVQRLGNTDDLVISTGFFREALADEIRTDPAFDSALAAIAPMIAIEGQVREQSTGRRAAKIAVYGVDERFWRFHGRSGGGWAGGSAQREALVSTGLAEELGVAGGAAILVRVARPSDVPIESLHGRKDDLGRTFRLTVASILRPDELGDFSLRPQQGRVRAVFVPMPRLQQELGLEGRVNTLLVSTARNTQGGSTTTAAIKAAYPRLLLEEIVRRRASLNDLGLTVRAIEASRTVAVDSSAGLLEPRQAAAAEQAAGAAGLEPRSVFTYLATSLRAGRREVPYSLVTAIDLSTVAAGMAPVAASDTPPIVLNDWTARDLAARPGDALTLEYDVWEEPGRLAPRHAEFRVAAIVPIQGVAADRNLAPTFPGITDSDTLADWDPPFPIDLRRVRPIDEAYWKQYRTTPKAFIPLDVGQRLWRSRYGDRTSVRMSAGAAQNLSEANAQYANRLRESLDPLTAGLSVADVRTAGLTASKGSTDFGEYFTYFSFFLVVSALLLAALFFRLGVEQRAREVGLFRAVGYAAAHIRYLFMVEGLIVTAAGGAIGIAGAIGYASLMMAGLSSWWSGAVGTDALRLHVSGVSLTIGVASVFVAAMACLWWTLRGLPRVSERRLLSGVLASDAPLVADRRRSRMPLIGAVAFGGLGFVFLAASAASAFDRTGGFFAAGNSLLAAGLCLVAYGLRRPRPRPVQGRGWWAVSRLGLRHAAARPGRSVLVVSVIAAATFILISVDAFRRVGAAPRGRQTGVGGYGSIIELLLPLVHDPNGREGREATGLMGFEAVKFEPFRMRPGDDSSCLNLYEPKNPEILGARQSFLLERRFAFQSVIADATADERTNPWLLLNRALSTDRDTIVPVIADANSMTYVLHKQLGDDIAIDHDGRSVRLRLVAALGDSIFQSQLMMSEANFLRLFPDEPGYRLMLAEVPPADASEFQQAIEAGGRDLGLTAVSTAARLADFHRVENTYISTFQMLGGLGLLVGTIGLGAVLLRNVFERHRELALLEAVGYRKAHVFAVVLAENVLLLVCGLAIGATCAAIAVMPAVIDRGRWLPISAGGWALIGGVFAAGLLSSILATRAALASPLLSALRSE